MKNDRQPDLFGSDVPMASQGLVPSAERSVPLSPAAKLFQQQLARIDRLKQQLADLDAVGRRFAPLYEQTLSPLRSTHNGLLREMALWLDERLQGKALTTVQRRTAVSILCGLTEALAANGDAEMAALHNRHSPVSWADKTEADEQALREMVADLLGGDLPPDLDGASADALLAAARERLLKEADEKRAKREAAAAKRQARKTPNAAQVQAQTQQQDAEQSLRTLYRQLASALHPDRETDANSRATKTALMSEVNAAYAQRDLVTLMRLQVRAQLADAGAVARMDEQKLAGMTRLLKEQVAGLERERASLQQQLMHTFKLDRPAEVNERDLQRHLAWQVEELEEQLAQMQADLARVRNDAGFKRWLTEQRRLSRADF